MHQFLRIAACPALLLAPLSFAAAAEDGQCFFDLRGGLANSPTPDIEETVSASGGGSSTYEWQGTKGSGVQVSAAAISGRLSSRGGPVFGAQAKYDYFDISPTSYRRNDGTSFSSGGTELRHQTLGLDLMGGYGWASSLDPEELAVYVEAMPFVGAGVAFADTEGINGGVIVHDSGMGWFYEYGLRAGIYLTERQFIVGFNGFYIGGSSQVDVDLSGGGSSEITLERDGFGGGIEGGWRF
jgi:hypothetical protein